MNDTAPIPRSAKRHYIVIAVVLLVILASLIAYRLINANISSSDQPTSGQQEQVTSPGATNATGADDAGEPDDPSSRNVPSESGGNGNSLLNQ